MKIQVFLVNSELICYKSIGYSTKWIRLERRIAIETVLASAERYAKLIGNGGYRHFEIGIATGYQDISLPSGQ